MDPALLRFARESVTVDDDGWCHYTDEVADTIAEEFDMDLATARDALLEAVRIIEGS